MVEALGTIINVKSLELNSSRIYSGVLDYYDHWSEIDVRLRVHHDHLSPHSDAFGHDLVNMATYSFQILFYLDPKKIRLPESLLVVGASTEAFLFSLRCACDSVAAMLAYASSKNKGQVPTESLKKLINWVSKNPSRVNPQVQNLLNQDFSWFFKLRGLRDLIVHQGVHANIHCDGKQFNLWMHSHKEGWKTRTPLLPFLATNVQNLLKFSNEAAEVINKICGIPKDRKGTRVVSGVLIHHLHELMEIADKYNQPSP